MILSIYSLTSCTRAAATSAAALSKRHVSRGGDGADSWDEADKESCTKIPAKEAEGTVFRFDSVHRVLDKFSIL